MENCTLSGSSDGSLSSGNSSTMEICSPEESANARIRMGSLRTPISSNEVLDTSKTPVLQQSTVELSPGCSTSAHPPSLDDSMGLVPRDISFELSRLERGSLEPQASAELHHEPTTTAMASENPEPSSPTTLDDSMGLVPRDISFELSRLERGSLEPQASAELHHEPTTTAMASENPEPSSPTTLASNADCDLFNATELSSVPQQQHGKMPAISPPLSPSLTGNTAPLINPTLEAMSPHTPHQLSVCTSPNTSNSNHSPIFEPQERAQLESSSSDCEDASTPNSLQHRWSSIIASASKRYRDRVPLCAYPQVQDVTTSRQGLVKLPVDSNGDEAAWILPGVESPPRRSRSTELSLSYSEQGNSLTTMSTNSNGSESESKMINWDGFQTTSKAPVEKSYKGQVPPKTQASDSRWDSFLCSEELETSENITQQKHGILPASLPPLISPDISPLVVSPMVDPVAGSSGVRPAKEIVERQQFVGHLEDSEDDEEEDVPAKVDTKNVNMPSPPLFASSTTRSGKKFTSTTKNPRKKVTEQKGGRKAPILADIALFNMFDERQARYKEEMGQLMVKMKEGKKLTAHETCMRNVYYLEEFIRNEGQGRDIRKQSKPSLMYDASRHFKTYPGLNTAKKCYDLIFNHHSLQNHP